MEFVHTPYEPGETIAALATPPGEGGVAIIRISGAEAIDVAAKVFSGDVKNYKTHTAHYGHVVNSQKKIVDGALLLVMKGSKSYTGEDTVEIQCHGGSLIARRVLETVLKAGARAAKPGEFTFKAFINGKIDLLQAEAVQELICAKNEYALDLAENQLQGLLSEKIDSFQKELTKIAAILEAWIDFPEEGLEFASEEEIIENLQKIIVEMEKLLDTFQEGKIVHEGITICLIGCPNVGKSSLMNTLLDKERAIVSPIAGTTRDVLEDHIRLNGLHIKLMDTAGIRTTEEAIELEGIKRSKESLRQADIVLLLLDASRPLTDQDALLFDNLLLEKTVVIWNKIDCAVTYVTEVLAPHIAYISAKEKIGILELKQKIQEVIWTKGMPSTSEIMLTNVRHKEYLSIAANFCQIVVENLQNSLSPEFLTMDMKKALEEIGKIKGTNISEDILSSIFSTFCIGK